MLKAIYEDIIQCINGCSLPCFDACVAPPLARECFTLLIQNCIERSITWVLLRMFEKTELLRGFN